MKKYIFLWILFITAFPIFSQENEIVETNIEIQKEKKSEDIPLDSIKNMYGARYVDYKMITYDQDTVQIDTTLTIQKYFAHNYTHQDDFEWLAFANMGQTFNKLGYDFVNNQITPKLGITAKQYNFYKVEDINYYHVPTPTTILNYRSGFTGQYLNSLFTTNFGRYNNVAINYKGLRSQGDYQRVRVSHVNFSFAYSYFNPAKRYQFRTHIISQKLSNFENGGLTESSVINFKNDNPDFSARSRINVNLASSESFLKSTRYYYEHELRILNSKDSLDQHLTNLKLGHHISYEKSKYTFDSSDTQYFDNNPNIYGTRLDTINSGTSDKTDFTETENQVYLKFNSPWILGNFKVFSSLYNFNQSYDNSLIVGSNIIPKSKTTSYTSAGANWNGKLKGIFLNAYAEQVISGGNFGSNLHVNAGFKLKNNTLARAGIQLKTAAPNTNTMYYQSNFSNLNWNQNFENIVYRTIYGNIKTKWINADAYIHQIKNYTYYNSNSVASQNTETIDYLKVKVNNEFKFGKFRLNNTIMYQKLARGSDVFRVPEFVTRNTLYYQDYFFKGKPLLAQIGIGFKYFTKYYANAFNPVLNEFYLQNNTQIGDYPTFDVFVNGEVRRTRIYFKVENVTAALTGRNYFVTPNSPARDLSIRLGLIWNFWN
ncbi:putative porin [Wenyingzhuangia sp. chi5]|uniref:Porin n=1 Tax=Wenyingzhuangia gilva TaxID=3057677 RepID=A0ABT8VNR8_9FLAO|nr:putative porin [Wenyingzhuangia sp. chi5]MDO3693606.1 putative porin [Wenyingzhuangia sp. chi5]